MGGNFFSEMTSVMWPSPVVARVAEELCSHGRFAPGVFFCASNLHLFPQFIVRERRRLGGYTANSSRYCPRCERIVNQQIQQTWEAREQTAKQNTARAVQVDAAIRRAPNPLEIAFYRAKLLAFLRYWQEGDIRKFGPSFSYSYQRHSALLHLPLMFPPMRIGVMTYAGLTAYALAPDGSTSSPCKAGSRRADRLQAIR